MQWTFWCFLLLVCVLGIHAFTIPHHDSSSTQNGTGDDASLKLILAKNLTSSVISSGRHRRYIILARSNLRDNITEECSSSSDDFPSIFTNAQVENGAIVAVFLIGIYCFTLLALICDKYFLPCVEKICEALNLSQDVAAATFMSVATSTPELFVNIIGTFITESDIGIGTVVGSSLFNTLGVASLGGLAAASPIQLHWWPVTRDVIIYIFAIVLLVVITWDGVIYWYEGLILFIVYFLYFTVMFQNVRICNFVKRIFKRNKVNDVVEKKSSVSSNNIKDNNCTSKETSENKDNNTNNQKESISETAATQRRASVAVISAYGSYMEEPRSRFVDAKVLDETDSKNDEETSLFSMPQGSIWKKLFFFYAWPLKFILFCTIPDPQKHPKFFPLTFIMCIFWIGTNSYVISWMIAIIGNMFHIPDAVLGLTFLAAGGCLPEAISITIMSRRGEGSMGVSNSLGANTMNILVSLGMPWFLKTITMGTNDSAFILINSGSIEYTISALIFVAIALYLTFYFNKFKLSKTVGVILISIYLVCIVLAILAELVFFEKAKCTPAPQGVRSHPLF